MNSAETSLKVQVRLAARTVRHSPDRALHPVRRWAQQRRLQRARLPRAVLFVCHGNICRSPYAAHVFHRVLPPVLQESMLVGSAGFFGPDRSSPATALQAAALRGIDLGAHRSVLLNSEVVCAMDLIVVMEAVQRDQITLWYGADSRRVVVLGDLDPGPIDTRTIRDPILQPIEVFSETYERIDRCVAELWRSISGEHAAPAAALTASLPSSDAEVSAIEVAVDEAPLGIGVTPTAPEPHPHPASTRPWHEDVAIVQQ